MQKEFTKQDKITKQLTTSYKSQVDKLTKDLSEKQEEIKAADAKISEMKKEVQRLESRLKDETINLSLEANKVSDLTNQLHQLSGIYKQESAIAKSNYFKLEINTKQKLTN